jgi:N-methylhydantoinase A
MNLPYRVGVDVGGTFTDVVVVDEETGEYSVTRTPSTPKDQSIGVEEVLRKIAQKSGISYGDISRFIHGTTVATNALLERKGAKSALITTKGFRDVFEIARQTRPDLYDFWAKRPRPPIERHLVFEVSERVLFDGRALKELDPIEVKDIVEKLRESKVESVAICLLHSYANPSHEEKLKEIISNRLPGVHLSISSEILPEIREYERTCVTAINAYVLPRVERYLMNLLERKDRLGIKPTIHVMESNGGIMDAKVAGKRSVHTLLSGPAAGVLAAKSLSQLTREQNLITLDMGGTSTDICLMEGGEYYLTTEREIAQFPIRVPVIDIHTIGAGGGSIAWIDEGGAMIVGPQSAGADPGPACYNIGGTEPTVTDGNLLVGHLNPNNFLGGEIRLFPDKAKSAIKEHLSVVGKDPVENGEGILRVVNSNMVKGIMVVSVQRGYDPRKFDLVAFGGAGPMHAAFLARELGIRRIIVPPNPGNFCAFGAVLANVRYDYVTTCLKPVDDLSVDDYNKIYEKIKSSGTRDLAVEGFSQDKVLFACTADMRYKGQTWELTVPTPDAVRSPQDIQRIAEDFHAIHKRTYGYDMKDEKVIAVNLRAAAIGEVPKVRMKKRASENEKPPSEARTSFRNVFSGGTHIEYQVFDRTRLVSGNALEGPAIIEEYGSTTVIPPGMKARVDSYDNIIIDR